MAANQYIAISKGYVDGRVIKEGEAFTHDFRELVRDESKPAGRGGAFPIKRDENGEAVTKKGEDPSWVTPATKQDYAAATAAEVGQYDDVNLSELSASELRAHAVGIPVDVSGLKTKEELLAAIRAWNDPKR